MIEEKIYLNELSKRQAKKLEWNYHLEELFSNDIITYSPNQINLIKDLLFSHLPSAYRAKFWFISSGAKREMLTFPNYYNNILNNYPDYIPCLFEQTIDKDLTRTFPEEKFYQQKENLIKLKNILMAYSRRNSTIGYIQGFNIIVGRILEVMKDEVIKLFLLYYII